MSRVVILFLLLLPVSGQTVPKGSSDPFLKGAPLTFDQVMRLSGENAIPLQRRKQAIQNRGVDFSATPEQIDKLRAAGASDDVLKLIKSKAKPGSTPAPRNPKLEPQGAVAVTCAPLECEISLNGASVGPTHEGRLDLAKLRPGSWAIDFKKDGYISSQSLVTVEAGSTLPVAATLEPARSTQEAFGSALLEKVVAALGGVEALNQLASVQATGSTTIATDGKAARWTLVMRNRPDRALFQMRAGGGILREVAFQRSEFKISKNWKGQEALDVPTGFGLIRDNQLPALIARLRNPQCKVLANHADPVDGEEYSLFAENGAEKISIGLDNELRPQRIRITNAAEVGSAIITYSDYFKAEKVVYPKTISIKPDGWKQGIDLRFDSVALGPKLADKDYNLRGKPLPDLGK